MITLTKATPKAVRYACLNFHYAKAVPAVKYAYNVYNENKNWCGVIIYSAGANAKIGSSFGLCQGEVLELVRVALNGKQPCTSECVAASLRQLHKDAPQVKIIVSYADTRQRHLGIIYQATNWIYLGDVQPSTKQYLIDGKWVHQRTVDSRKDKQMVLKRSEKRDASRKFKYIFVFNKRERKEWAKHGKPYPKDKDLTE